MRESQRVGVRSQRERERYDNEKEGKSDTEFSRLKVEQLMKTGRSTI